MEINDSDPLPDNDFGVPTPHDALYPDATGRLDETIGDMRDEWTLAINAPCFEGGCAQEYDDAVFGPPLPPSLRGKTFVCDLVVEVTDTTGFVRLFKNFPMSVAYAYEAHVVNVAAQFDDRFFLSDLYFSPEPGYDSMDAINPNGGPVNTPLTFRVVYTSPHNLPPPF